MKVLNYIHAYPPSHNAGAEWMVHEMNKYLVSCGHEVKVIILFNNTGYIFEGVEVVPYSQHGDWLNWCDIIITHLDAAPEAFNNSKALRFKPIVLIVHNHNIYSCCEFHSMNTGVVYNSSYTKDAINYAYAKHPNVILRPPIDFNRFKKIKGKRNGYICLINCFEDKGGKVVCDIAKSMPNEKFLCVKGSYGYQYVDESISNIIYVDNTDRIEDIYKKCKIILMPSIYESFGRVAVEAMTCGIPVIVSDTPGFHESVKDGGMYANIHDVQSWIRAIKYINKHYERQSLSAKHRAYEIEMNQANELSKFMILLNDLVTLRKY